MENTFLLFCVFALSFSILQCRALVHTFDPVPSISPALPVTLPYAHTPPNFPFVCFCGMFAFLSWLSQCVLGGGVLIKLLCIYLLCFFLFFFKKGNAGWFSLTRICFFLCMSVHEETHSFVCSIYPWSVCPTCWYAETELKMCNMLKQAPMPPLQRGISSGGRTNPHLHNSVVKASSLLVKYSCLVICNDITREVLVVADAIGLLVVCVCVRVRVHACTHTHTVFLCLGRSFLIIHV